MTAMTMAAAVTPALGDDRRGGYGYGYGNDSGYRRDMTYGNSNGRWRNSGNPVTSAMRDLESIFRRSRVDHHEADHFRDALRELSQFDDRARRGRFDRDSLNDAIENMRDLARADQLHPRDRQTIARRVQELRYFRDQGDRGWR
jgi:hypothetical protein